MSEPERYKVGETFHDPQYDGKKKLTVLASSVDKDASLTDQTSSTFVIGNEDHTLGNSLRYVLMKDPAVDFCGYSLPHPSERKIHLRIQTKGDKSTSAALQHGLKNLKAMTTHMLDTFEESVIEYRGMQE